MNKRWMKAVSLMAAVAMCGTMFAACGGGGPAGGKDDKVLNIAVPILLTGESAKAGKEIQQTIQMAFEDVGNKVGSYEIKLDFVDATSDADKGALALEEGIVKNGDEVVLSSWNSSVAVAMSDVVDKYQIPWFFSSSASSVINEKVEGRDNAYLLTKIWPKSESLAIGYFELLKGIIDSGEWDAEDVTFAVHADDTDFGRAFGKTVIDAMKEFGGECVYEDYTAINVTDFYTNLSKIKETGTHLAFVQLTNPASAAAFIKQAKETNLPCLMTSDCFTEASNWYELAGDAADDVLVCRSKLINDNAMKFAEAFEAKYGYAPAATTGGINYDGACFLIECIKACEEKYGEVTSQTLFQFGQEVLQTGGIEYKDSVLVADYKYDKENGIDPIVDEDHFYFQVLQLEGGKEVVVWPDKDKEADIVINDYMKGQ